MFVILRIIFHISLLFYLISHKKENNSLMSFVNFKYSHIAIFIAKFFFSRAGAT